MRYKSIQYFVGRLFCDQKNKNIKNCIRLKMENKTARLPGDRRFIFLQIAKNEAAIAERIRSILKFIRKFLILLLADRRFSIGRRDGMMVQIYNSI